MHQMLLLTITKLDNEIWALNIQGRNIFIKPSEVSEYEQALSIISRKKINFSDSLEIELSDKKAKQFRAKLEEVSHKKEMNLPKELSKSIEGNGICIRYRSLERYHRYWLSDESTQRTSEAELYQQLSDDIPVINENACIL